MSPDSPGSNTMTDQVKKITVSDITTRFEDAGLNHQALRNEEEEAPDVDKVIQNLKNKSQLMGYSANIAHHQSTNLPLLFIEKPRRGGR